ncbi:MAG: hypothetical protein PUD59_00115 [bacterium]|nr:hypothetical protein [bacterium]
MNVIISNQQDNIINGLNVEVIKQVQGEYNVEDIISSFSTFFFNKMIIDVTALNDYTNIITYQKLSIGLPVDKIILLVPSGTVVATQEFLSKLISMGYYNFTTNLEGLQYLMEHPNSYKDVAHIHKIDTNNNESGGVIVQNKKLILGIKNVTESAGSTTLAYLMYKELTDKYNVNCVAIEVDKNDFSYFNDQNLVSISNNDLANTLLKNQRYDIIIVDLNTADPELCGDCLYLIEPSIIKMNKLIRRDRNTFQKLQGKKIVLNKCLLSNADIKEFEIESASKIFYVIPPVDDRVKQSSLKELFVKLGIIANKM